MTTLIIGENNSGKSDLSEDILFRCGENEDRKIYIATMEICDKEGEERVKKHRKKRENKGFILFEEPLLLSSLDIKNTDHVLLEDVTNLLSNHLFKKEGGGEDIAYKEIEDLKKRCRDLILVSGSFKSFDKASLNEETKLFIKKLDGLNERLIQLSDKVIKL